METIQEKESSIFEIIDIEASKIRVLTGKDIISEIEIVDFTGTDPLFYKVRFTIDHKFYSEPFFIDYENPYLDLRILPTHLKFLFLE